MLLFDSIVIIALVTAVAVCTAVVFIVVSFVRAAPMLESRAGRTVDVVVIHGPRPPRRSAPRRAARAGLPALVGSFQPA